MKNIKLCVLVLSLIAGNIAAGDQVVKRGRLSTCYHNTSQRFGNHKGKVGLATGFIGATIINKAFSFEIDSYVKPFIRSVWKKTCNLFRRIFKVEEKV